MAWPMDRILLCSSPHFLITTPGGLTSNPEQFRPNGLGVVTKKQTNYLRNIVDVGMSVAGIAKFGVGGVWLPQPTSKNNDVFRHLILKCVGVA